MKILLPMVLVLLTVVSIQSCTVEAQETKPVAKNVILLIGDGMGLSQVHAAYTANGGSLNMLGADVIGMQTNRSANKYITDSAASGTAIACGKKTNNGMVGLDSSLVPLESILKVAERNGLATGLVSTSSVTHATPASFIANVKSRKSNEAIAADYLKTDIDVFIGGGLKSFEDRSDGVDLTAQLEQNGYTVARSLEEALTVSEGKLAAFTAHGHNPKILDDRGDMLPQSTAKALELLSKDEDGFFIMIEGSQIDWGGHDNDQDYVISETLDFDAAVKVALDFAKENGETLVVVTADHETGGMIVLNGDYESKDVKATFTTGGHTGVLIPVYSFGPGSEKFSGVFDNTDFKGKFQEVLGVE